MSWPLVLAGGGPRERGRAYGAAAADRIVRSAEIYEEVFLRYAELPWREVRARAGAFVDHLDAFDVELLPEIEGIAEGVRIDAEDVLALNLRTEIMFGLDARPGRAAAKTMGCTAIGIADVAGGPIVAQNWDWKPAVRETCVLLVCAPAGRPGFVTVVEAGLLAKFGVNERGLGLATNALTSSLDRGEPGVPFHAVLRRILTSETFGDAVDAIREAPRASSANYLIGSADGRLVDVEAAPGGSDGIRVTDAPRLAHTNHFTWPSPRPFKDVGRIDGKGSLLRYACASEAAARPTADVGSIENALGDHSNAPASVCAHDDPAVDPVEDYVTVTSFVATLGDGKMWLTDGNPCERSFRSVDVPRLLAEAAGREHSAPARG